MTFIISEVSVPALGAGWVEYYIAYEFDKITYILAYIHWTADVREDSAGCQQDKKNKVFSRKNSQSICIIIKQKIYITPLHIVSQESSKKYSLPIFSTHTPESNDPIFSNLSINPEILTIIKTNLADIHIKPKNATEAFYNSNVYNFSIPDNIDFNSSSNENSNNVLESSNVLKDEIYNCSNPYSKRQDKSHNSDDNNSEVKNSIFWSDALEVRLCELYMKNDVIDIFWGRLVEEHLKGSTNWNIYVFTHGLYCPYAKIERIADGQVIHFIAEETKFVISNDPLPSSIQIPQNLRENFDEALDNELGLLFREAHYNLVGIGTGYKQIRGQFTEEPAIIFYVRQKGILRRGCSGLFPKEIRGFPTDVIEACVATPCNSFEAVYCRSYQQDVKLGSSIGMGSNETRNTTGTLSAIAYDNNSLNQIGIISCEHVLKFNESNPEKNITIYQPSYNDQFEPRRRLRELLELSKELGEYEYIKDINIMREKLNIAESQNSKLATYVKGMRKNFLSKIDNKYYGVDAGFCVFDNESRKLCSKNFPIPSSYFKKAGLSTCLESTYTYCELKNFNHKKNRVFKVGRTTGLTLGELLPTDQAIACTIESIKNAKRLEMEKHIPCYNNADQKIFIGYMKSQLDSEIRQKRKKCYPIEWFDRQLVFKFESGDFDCGDSGASIIDETGKALGILHAKWITPCQTFGIASPYFAILEALDVSIQLSSDPVTPTVISSSSNAQNNYKKVQQTTNSQKNQSKSSMLSLHKILR
ncbi:hypothetical protein RhiirA4_515296 [Rhizophagus irregularis]|uniref:Uncharacterized protein n=1 Tax=Rhizophagus irregularis TaxID=588596 RepID=A0A2I1GE98_9GLOM|nr:hypothetical protein RhiirA4_515296 [Rhizophagus irregularis]